MIVNIKPVFFSAVIKMSLATLLIILTACTSTSGPVVIRESSPPIFDQKQSDSTGSETAAVAVQPVTPDKPINRMPVIEKLLTQSNAEIENKNYDKAIGLAERGLRINRKEPRLYLALSKAYRGEGNRQQSVYFAKQGLRYSEKGSEVSQVLKQLSK